MTELQRTILASVEALQALNQAQMKRFLFETGLLEAQDIKAPVAELRAAGLLRQIANDLGIQYVITDEGIAALKAEPLAPETAAAVQQHAVSYRKLFATEEDFLATYSEQASEAVPVFLSIRQREKVLFKIQVIVNNVETAQLLQKEWRANAQNIFRDTWQLLAPGQDMPKFE